MGRGTVRGERRHGGGRNPAPPRGRQGDGAAHGEGDRRQDDRRRYAIVCPTIDPLAERDAIERAAAGDREDGPGRGGRRRGDPRGLQARASARRVGRACIVAGGPGAARRPGNRPAGGRVPVRRRGRVLPQDGAARTGGVRRGADRGDGGADPGSVGPGGRGRDSGAAGGFAEVSGVLAGGDLSARRDVAGGGGGGGRAAATGALRPAAAQAGEARGPPDDDAAQRTAPAVLEHAGSEGREERGGPASEGQGETTARGEDRRDLPGEPDGEYTDHHAGGAGAVRGGGAGVLLLDGRVVLRDHAGVEHEERIPAAEPVPAGGAGVFRANDRAAAGGGEDSQSEKAVAT